MTDRALRQLQSALEDSARAGLAGPWAVLVRVEQVQGSSPRDVGAWMAVFPDQIINTLGGGHLEWTAISRSRDLLIRREVHPDAGLERFALGPALGQCCGGVVHLRFGMLSGPLTPEQVRSLAEPLAPVALFGGGHVGKALVHILSTLPVAVRWIDSRDEIFPAEVPPHVVCEHSDPVQDAVSDVVPGSRVLIMSFSHAEDLDVVMACLKRQRERADLSFIGLIGSATKWATFRHRLRDRGFSEGELSGVTCPIGLPGIEGKAPEVIAVSVAAQILLGDKPLA